jgi:hypothetical protein
LDFTGAASGNSGFAVLVVFKANSIFEDNTRNQLIGDSSAVTEGFLMRYDRGSMGACLGGTSVVKNGPCDAEMEAVDTIVLAFNYNAASGRWSSTIPRATLRTLALFPQPISLAAAASASAPATIPASRWMASYSSRACKTGRSTRLNSIS